MLWLLLARCYVSMSEIVIWIFEAVSIYVSNRCTLNSSDFTGNATKKRVFLDKIIVG